MKLRVIIGVMILLVLTASPVLASTYTNAVYRTGISITNTGSTKTSVAVAFDLDTGNLISGGMLNSEVTNAAMIGNTGDDIAFMPGYDDNPWITFVDSIGDSSTVTQNLYSVDVTGGKTAIFCDDSGMTIDDDASIEIGDDFIISLTNAFLIDSLNPIVMEKPQSWGVGYASGILSGIIPGGASATHFQYDATTSQTSLLGSTRRSQEFSANATILLTQIQLKLYRVGSPGTLNVYLKYADDDGLPTGDAISSGSYNANTLGTATTGTYVAIDMDDVFLYQGRDYVIECSVPSGDVGNYVHWKFTEGVQDEVAGYSGDDGSSWVISPRKFAYKIDGQLGASTSIALEEGEYSISFSADSSDIILAADDSSNTTSLAGLSAPDNSNDLIIGSSTLYFESFVLSVGGTEVSNISWNYMTNEASTISPNTGAVSGNPVTLIEGDNTITVTFAGTLDVQIPYGWSVVVTSGTAVVNGSPVHISSPTTRGTSETTSITVSSTGDINVALSHVFVDQSNNGNDATPSLRTASSDPDITGSVISQESLVTSSQPTAVIVGGANLIPEDITAPDKLFSEGGTNFPWGDEIAAAAEDAGLPKEAFLIPIAYGTALIAGFAVMGTTRKTKVGSNGSLSLMAVTCIVVMALWVYGGDGVIPGWTLIPFGLLSLLLLIFRNPFNPVN